MSIIYEVNLEISQEIEADFLSWLESHISQMLAFDGFQSASTERIIEKNKSTNVKLCVRYLLENHDYLDSYLANHATTMRQEGLKLFGDKMSASRRISEILPKQKT